MKLKFLFYSIIILVTFLLELLSFYKSSFFEFSLSSLIIGTIVWVLFYINSQEIINDNLFKEYTFLGMQLLVLNIILQRLVNENWKLLFFSAVPLIYILYFRLVLGLFFKDYAESYKKPVVVFSSKSGLDYENKENGYVPSRTEKIFSITLVLGFFALIGGIIIVVILASANSRLAQ